MTLESLFFELLQVTVKNRSQLSVIPTSEEWVKMKEQADYYQFLNTLDLMAQSYESDGTPAGKNYIIWPRVAATLS